MSRTRANLTSMRNELPLRQGDELRCPHCRRWHRVTRPYPDHPNDTSRNMLFFACARGDYFAGHEGYPSRHETRRAAA